MDHTANDERLSQNIGHLRGHGRVGDHVPPARSGWMRGAILALFAVIAACAGPGPAGAGDMPLRGPLLSGAQLPSIVTPLVRAGSPKVRQSKRPCTCRYRGSDVQVGQSICMRTTNGMRRATCSRYLNNTSWEISGDDCAIS